MWRIKYLYLKNISYLYSGLHKTEVEIDFTELNRNSKLNLIVGPMGSGKSVILGHLQPFSSFGTLDARNSEKMILEEKNGRKIIIYEHDNHLIEIQHDYIWNKNLKTHNVKSYMKIDGEELNTNGNSGSFKELVKIHFGIDQSFLRILRLGPNVSNVIAMPAVDRKKFIASLRSDTELYLTLYKKLNDDFKILKASIASISNRLMKLSATNLMQMQEDETQWSDEFENTNKKIGNITQRIGQLQGEISSLCNGNLDKYLEKRENTITLVQKLAAEIEEYEDTLKSISDSGETLESIAMKIGSAKSQITASHELLLKQQKALKDLEADIMKLNEFFLVRQDNTHLEEMKSTMKDIEDELLKYQMKLSGFSCRYSYDYLAKFIDDLNIFEQQLEDLSNIDEETFKILHKNLDANITKIVDEKVHKLRGRQVNLQKSLANIRFSSTYVEQFPLFRDPRCRFDQCPYFTTHPVTVRKTLKNDNELDATLVKITNEINALDPIIARYQEMPVTQKKMQLLRNQWKTISEVLININVITPDLNLWDLLLNPNQRNDWYHYQKLIDILEKCKMSEEFDKLHERYRSIKTEIQEMESPEVEMNRQRLEESKIKHSTLMDEIEQLCTNIDENERNVNAYELLYSNIQKRAKIEKEYSERREFLASTNEELSKMDTNLETIRSNQNEIKQLENEKFGLEQEYLKLQAKLDDVRSTMNQIEYNQSEYNDLIKQAEYYTAIMDAVSAKKGIPLILVRYFLNNCREIINDLIADVFEDELEILDFEITETDFKIPYMVNGQVISDISYASQGQQSIISIALSFALVRQSIQQSGGMNIMLLDEMDGPLHRDDREKFIGILFKQMAAIDANQVFIISHNSTFAGNPINIISTSDEEIEASRNQIVIRL